MSINANQLKEWVIIPTLKQLDMHSEAAVNLLLGTAAQESACGTYLKQLGAGPARGIYQMEPAAYADIWKNYLVYDMGMSAKVRYFMSDADKGSPESGLITNLAFATAMCRVHYRRVREGLPAANDIAGLASYWKRYYNTVKGKGTEKEFIANYNKYIG